MEKWLNVSGRIDSSATQTHITYTFPILEQSSMIRIEFNYTPKTLTDTYQAKEMIESALLKYGYNDPQVQDWQKYAPLHNLITLSIDDPQTHRGQAHRQDPQQTHFLSADHASPGFWKGFNPVGQWKVTLSIHSVVTPECDYQLEVWGN